MTVQLKIFAQKLCEARLDWDETVSGEVLQRWINYRSNLLDLKSITIPRCYFQRICRDFASYMLFRQQAATSNTVDWSQLNSTLYAVTFLAQQGNRTRPCTLCMESDHREDECSLGSDDHPMSVKRDGAGHLKEFNGLRQQQVCFTWNEGRCFCNGCRFRHVCARCQGEHRLIDCRQFPLKYSGRGSAVGGYQRDNDAGSMRGSTSQGQVRRQ